MKAKKVRSTFYLTIVILTGNLVLFSGLSFAEDIICNGEICERPGGDYGYIIVKNDGELTIDGNVTCKQVEVVKGKLNLYGGWEVEQKFAVQEGTVSVTPYNSSVTGTGTFFLQCDELVLEGGCVLTADGAGGDTRGVGGGMQYYSGGSYGGDGGNWSGRTYGDYRSLTIEMGSQGGGVKGGGKGGGKIHIIVSKASIHGTVSANAGPTPRYSAGGSGGGILIQCAEIDFTGSISANGGTGDNSGSGGGGGRIKIVYDTGFAVELLSQIEARGGTGYRNGEDGTIWTNVRPEPPALVTPEDGGRVDGTPTFRFTILDKSQELDGRTDETLACKIELSRDNFETICNTFDQNISIEGWSKLEYLSGNEAQFTPPEPLLEGRYQWRAYTYDTRLWSKPSEIRTFTISDDVTPPVITAGPSVSEVTTTSAVIIWSTDEESDSVVEYGEAPEYGLTAEQAGNVTEHSVALSSLSPDITYYYRVGSTDAGGNTVWSEQRTFKTLAEVVPRTLSITSAEAPPGTKATVQLSITDASGVTGGEIFVKYDDKLLIIGEVEGTDLISDMTLLVNKDVPGEVKIGILGAEGIPSGSGPLVQIELAVDANAQAGTETLLEFGDTEIYDETGAVIPVDLENGVLKVAPPGIKGDVNNDGEVRANDAILALRISIGLTTPTNYQNWAADMNEDGNVKANDAILILRKSIGLAAPTVAAVATLNRGITVALAEVHGVAGESVAVALKVDSVAGLAGGYICIAYDNTVLRAVDVSTESDMLLVSNIEKSGTVQIAFSGVNGLRNRTLAKVKLDILTDDISPLILQRVELYQPDALPIDSRKVDGKFISWAVPPGHSALLQNFPNPFNPDTWIPYQLTEGVDVVIRIYDVSGKVVRILDLGHKPAGFYTAKSKAAYWDGKNEAGEPVASGVYFYTIQAREFMAAKKMIVAK